MELRGEKMKRLNIRDSFSTKNFKFGGYAAMMTAIVLAILIVVNLVVGQLNIKIDLTKNQLYSLSEQTYDVINNLDQDITIYALYETGKENTAFNEILNNYSEHSKRIHIEYKDPVLYPQFASQYDKEGGGIKTGSLIIVGSNNKFKVISPHELINYSMNQQTFQTIAESLAVEQKVTGAIQYIMAEKIPTIYTLEGHEEVSLPGDIIKQLGQENYEVKNLNLLTMDKFPEDGDILMVLSPRRDISIEEAEKINEFLEKQGRAIFIMGIKENEMPNMEGIINSYGVGLENAIIVERDTSRQFQNPVYIIPGFAEHDILNPLRAKKLPVLIPFAQAIEILQVKKKSIDIAPLLISSEDSYAKTNPNSETIEKEAEDLEGPFNVAVAITDKWYEDNQELITRVVVIGNKQFLDPQINAVSAGGNMDFFLNSINWLVDREESITIRPKSLLSRYLNLNMFQVLLFSGIAVILIPLAIGIVGIVVWLRRKNK